MTDTLTHRGPDSSGYFADNRETCQVGLGHRRLSIIDLSECGRQPMHFKHLRIIFNGEIYNYAEIKKELTALGHSFIGHSDTEVLLHAYDEWKEKCLEKLIGMFVFVVFDTEKNELFCARDRSGVKPLFYYWHNGLFLFSSELKAFHTHPGFEKKLDLNSLAAFIEFGNIPAPHCIFENCFKLKPGHYLTLSLKNRTLSISRYWNVYDAYNRPKLDISFDAAKAMTEGLLQNAFSYRMVSDVPVGIFLSGGYDSACLTSLLQTGTGEKIKTFTIGVPDIGLNEAPYAKAIAGHLGTDHHEFMCTEKEVLELISQLPYYYDEPFADSSAIPTTLVCRMARQQVTVALSADGGDEVFAGYNRYDYLIKYGKFLNSMPKYMRDSASRLMQKINSEKIPYFSKQYNFHNRYEKLKLLLKDPSPRNMLFSLSKQYDDEQIGSLFLKDVVLPDNSYLSKELNKEFHSPLSYMMAVDYQTYLPDDILQKVDRASMSASLEAREPFLDHRIIEWAARLPDNYKYHKGVKKYILKEIVYDYIPKKLMDRPKMGFAIPIEKWLQGEIKEKVDFYLSDDRIGGQNIFNVKMTSTLKRDFFAGKKELGQKIWYLLMFQMWYEKWME